MIRINNIKMPVKHSENDLKKKFTNFTKSMRRK